MLCFLLQLQNVTLRVAPCCQVRYNQRKPMKERDDMKLIRRWFSLAIALMCLLPAACCLAELPPERVAFFQQRTEEWENALGDYVLWDYNQRAMFCTIYGRLPGDYLNDESVREDIPKYPTSECIPYEEAVCISRGFLCDWDQRITAAYLDQLHVGSAYYDFWGDSATTVTGKEHTQVWVIQFGEWTDQGEYIVRCDAYVEAVTGEVVCIDIGLDIRYAEDWQNQQWISFVDR